MNFDSLQDRLDVREQELEVIRWGEPYGYLKVIKSLNKIKKLRAKIDTRITFLKSRARDENLYRQFRIALSKFQQNKRFMVFDIERTAAGELHEIGITLIQGKNIESFNYRVKGIVRAPTFLFGKTMEATIDVVKSLIQTHAASADFYVGHSIDDDFKHLREEGIELPKKYFYDIQYWARRVHGRVERLYDLTQRYGVGCSQMHCGGNDARYTGEIFLKMIHEYG